MLRKFGTNSLSPMKGPAISRKLEKDTIVQEYKNFKLIEEENIIYMETRFTRIVDKLEQL